MRLTNEQFEQMSKYETQFRTAINSKWARIPSTAALYQMHHLLSDITGRKTHLNTSCSSCVLRLLTEMGQIYFADKTQRGHSPRVQEIGKDIPVQEKVEVKTKRPRKPKTK
jgi:hypothetical protein